MLNREINIILIVRITKVMTYHLSTCSPTPIRLYLLVSSYIQLCSAGGQGERKQEKKRNKTETERFLQSLTSFRLYCIKFFGGVNHYFKKITNIMEGKILVMTP